MEDRIYLKEEQITQEQFAAAMAHEIRNPLAIIKANLQFVELNDKESVNKKNYEVIYRELDRISELIIDYLEASKPHKLKLRKFMAEELILEVADIFNALLAGKIDLSVNIIDKGIKIKADYNMLKQVLINVVQNAAESEGTTSIDISVFKTDNIATINVCDNGSGITERDLNAIGTPFFTTKEKGTGLGLSISKGILRMHKGSLNITGIEGKGAAVSISLPVCP